MKTRLASLFDGRFFFSRLFATPRGRAFFLSTMADAEESDEAGVFDALLERVDDPKLHKMVRRHADDETRHAELLRGRVRAIVEQHGIDMPAPPPGLGIVPLLDEMLGGLAEKFVAKERSVMDAYVLLEVVEDRAVQEFPRVAEALEPFDPESAAVVRSIWEDEKRHVLYARAINKRYAPDADALSRALAKMRKVEKRAFDAHGAHILRHVLAENLLEVPFAERMFFRAIAAAA
jgi:rubrerythrin